MDTKVLGVCLAVGLLGLLSALTGFAAEFNRIKIEHVLNPQPFVCVYPSSSVPGFGFTAAVALLLAEIITSVATGCFSCSRGPPLSGCKCAVGVICFILSWIVCVPALLLLSCAVLSVERTDNDAYSGGGECYVVGAGVFAAGAILSIISVFLGIVSYLMSNPGKNIINDPWRQPPYVPGSIALGQPQLVPPSQNAQPPVFEYDDTYAKRQVVV